MNRHVKSLIVSAVMIVISIAGATVANATDCGELDGDCFTRFYAGITGGGSSVSSAALETGSLLAVDPDDLAVGVIFGYRLNKFFGFESVGNYFGEPTYDNAGTPMDTRICDLGLGVNFYLPLGEVVSDPNLNFISLFAKGGMHYWDAAGEESVSGLEVFEDDGLEPFYGLGLNLDVSRLIALRAEYTVYELGDGDDVTTEALSLLFKF